MCICSHFSSIHHLLNKYPMTSAYIYACSKRAVDKRNGDQEDRHCSLDQKRHAEDVIFHYTDVTGAAVRCPQLGYDAEASRRQDNVTVAAWRRKAVSKTPCNFMHTSTSPPPPHRSTNGCRHLRHAVKWSVHNRDNNERSIKQQKTFQQTLDICIETYCPCNKTFGRFHRGLTSAALLEVHS